MRIRLYLYHESWRAISRNDDVYVKDDLHKNFHECQHDIWPKHMHRANTPCYCICFGSLPISAPILQQHNREHWDHVTASSAGDVCGLISGNAISICGNLDCHDLMVLLQDATHYHMGMSCEPRSVQRSPRKSWHGELCRIHAKVHGGAWSRWDLYQSRMCLLRMESRTQRLIRSRIEFDLPIVQCEYAMWFSWYDYLFFFL